MPFQLEMLAGWGTCLSLPDRFVRQALGIGDYWILAFLWMSHHFHSSLACRGVKYAVILKGLKKETVIRYLSLLCGGSSKMCHISFVQYVELQEGLGSWGGQGGDDFSRAQLWLLCSSVAPACKWQRALCMLSERVYRASLEHITSDIWSE